MNISSGNDPLVPFEGFSLERSTSFSEKKDEFTAAQFEEHQIANAPKNLQQKHTQAEYGLVELDYMERKKLSPLERKPSVFAQGKEQQIVAHHIEAIKASNMRN